MDIYLKHYTHINNEPLKSITQLPEKEALSLAIKHRDESPCVAHSRFGSVSTFNENFLGYYNARKNVEEVLYERFIELGGKPQIKNPYYFFVNDWGLMHKDLIQNEIDRGAAHIIEIRLQDIDISDVSFFLGDTMTAGNSNEPNDIFLKDKLIEEITSHNGFDNYFDSIKSKYLYIEAHLWTDKYCHLYHTV